MVYGEFTPLSVVLQQYFGIDLLVAIKNFWRLLHKFVKPAVDADTLKIPVPLLDVLNDQLRSLKNLNHAKIVTVLSSDLNYFQYRHGGLKNLAQRLKSILAEAQDFPAGLGFIAIPYSQGSGFFTNILIYHELGHFVFEELSKGAALAPELDSSLRRTFGPAFDASPEQTQKWCRDRLMAWSEEIYCDLFALWLSGPAFSFASIELFSLLGLLDSQGSIRFSLSHPADACRFREHLIQLTDHHWWDVIKGLGAEHVKLIQALADKPEDYAFPIDDPWGAPLVRAFLDVRPAIRKLVSETLEGVDTGLAGFREWNFKIQDCLSHGIVPSVGSPPPTAIINAAFCFYLESLPSLVNKTRECNAGKVADRSALARRLELWTLKALEDYKLLAGAARKS